MDPTFVIHAFYYFLLRFFDHYFFLLSNYLLRFFRCIFLIDHVIFSLIIIIAQYQKVVLSAILKQIFIFILFIFF